MADKVVEGYDPVARIVENYLRKCRLDVSVLTLPDGVGESSTSVTVALISPLGEVLLSDTSTY